MGRILVWVVGVIAIYSCGSAGVLRNELPIETYTEQDVLEALNNRSFDYFWLSGKAKTKIDTPEESASGLMYLRNPKDSLIWLVVKKRSAEAVRILMNPDSLYVIYRLENTFEKRSIQEINEKINLNLTFQELQDLVSGQVPIPDNPSVFLDSAIDSIVVKGSYKQIDLTYYLEPSKLRLIKAVYMDKEGKTITATFNKYQEIKDKGEIPYFRSYTFTSGEGERSYIELEIIDIEFDKPARILFKIPDHYDQIF